MSSQLDLDQGGTNRQYKRVYLGPSVGWFEVPDISQLNVIVGGAQSVLLGTTLILVNFNGAVTLNLPAYKGSLAGAQALPRQFANISPIIIAEIGGFAAANPITINAFGSERFDGLATFTLASNFGVRMLRPDPILGGGNILQ